MKTRTTRVTLTKKSISDSDCFDISITDEGGGEYLVVSWGMDGNSISIDPSEWPFLRDAIDRMFVEIAENESEAKLKKLLETPAPWEKASEEQAPPAKTSEPTASDAGWIPWEGGECPAHRDTRVFIRFRDGTEDHDGDHADSWFWRHEYGDHDIIAYKVVN
jgi:hypothetical protein